jgi:hypothetical protein
VARRCSLLGVVVVRPFNFPRIPVLDITYSSAAEDAFCGLQAEINMNTGEGARMLRRGRLRWQSALAGCGLFLAHATIATAASTTGSWTLWASPANGVPFEFFPTLAYSPQTNTLFYSGRFTPKSGDTLGSVWSSPLSSTPTFTKLPQTGLVLPIPATGNSILNVASMTTDSAGEPIIGTGAPGNTNQSQIDQTKLYRFDKASNQWVAPSLSAYLHQNIPVLQPNNIMYALTRGADGTIWGGGQWGKTYRSTDDGQTFTVIDEKSLLALTDPTYYTTGSRIPSGSDGAIYGIRVAPNGYIYEGTETAGVIYSPDNGATWLPLDYDYTNSTSTMTRASNVGNVAGIGFTKDGKIVAQGAPGSAPYDATHLYLFDPVNHTQQLCTGFPDYFFGSQDVQTIMTTPDGTMFINTGRNTTANGAPAVGGVFTSTDGLNWTALNTGLTSVSTADFRSSGPDSMVVVGNDIYLSTTDGKIWKYSTQPSNQWAQNSGGSWSVAGNWSTSLPNGAGTKIGFLSTPIGLTNSATINLDGNRTIGQITFDNPNGYTIAPGTGGSLTIDDSTDNTGMSPSIIVNTGNHSITAPISLANGVIVATASGTSLTIASSITGNGALTANGAGTFIISSGGSLNIPLTVNGNVTFTANAGNGILLRTVSSISIGPIGKLSITDPAPANHLNRSVLTASALSFAGATNNWQGTLDLAGNDLVVYNGDLNNIANQLKTGLHGSGGIASTTAAQDTTHMTTLGYRIGGIAFDGLNTTTADMLVKYTYNGDADLNGVINGADYQQIDNGFGQHLTGWFNGDFNYDGVIDGTDYSLIDNTFNQISASGASPLSLIATRAVTSSDFGELSRTVPEPKTLGLLGIGAIGLLGQRRRKVGHNE